MFNFLKQFILRPIEIGTPLPLGPSLSKYIVEMAKVGSGKILVELGPGTGPVTREIIAQKSKDSNFLAIELNPSFYEILKVEFPDLKLFKDSAEHIQRILAGEGYVKCDRIVSGLPWAAFDQELQVKILHAAHAALEDDGIFVTVTYIHSPHLPAGKTFKKLLTETFRKVELSRIVWKNVPPAFVYICTK